jgi:predicted tellurium resistance membrane protein TerC
MDAALLLLSSPAAWAALVTLIVMEVVLGIDNLIFISLLTNKLPEAARRFGGWASPWRWSSAWCCCRPFPG